MEKNSLVELINKKVKEHQFEIDHAQRDLLDERGQLKKKSVAEASKMLVLKDKIMFHKSCILALEDLKKEIVNA